jgi:hypothetical protein
MSHVNTLRSVVCVTMLLTAAAASAQSNFNPVLIYTVCLTDEYDGDADPETLERLSHASGALAFAPREVADAPKILERIARTAATRSDTCPDHRRADTGTYASKCPPPASGGCW